MGCCCGCLRGAGGGSGNSETELSQRNRRKGSSNGNPLTISHEMTASTIQIGESGTEVSGHGLALAGVSIEQDAAYWEWHFQKPSDELSSSPDDIHIIMFGVATKQDAQKARATTADENDVDASPQELSLMKEITLSSYDDTVGIAVQQSDLPMIQFLVNGELMSELAINRFRGTVYPSICLPPMEDHTSWKAQVIFQEGKFRHLSPHARFGPVIAARGVI